MIKILHTGDIHLDSPFSRLDIKRAEKRKSELRAAFAAMMAYARMNAVDIIVISGDLFDCDFVTRETVGLIIREMENCKARIFIAAGNHDPISATSVYTREGVFPENVHVFGSDTLEKVSVDALGVDVYGYSFMTGEMYENPVRGRKVDDPERLNILVGHADTRSLDSKYCPVNEAMLSDFGADYAALGHIHNPEAPKKAGDCHYAYCGCLEGRDFGETGAKGALLIEAEKKNGKADINIKKLRFSKRRYERETLYVDGASSEQELIEKITSFVEDAGYGDETLLSLTIRGGVPSSFVINTDSVASRVNGLFFFELSDGTTVAEKAEELAADITVRGQFFRELEDLLTDCDEEEKSIAESALKYGLAALAGENIIDF